MFCRMITLLATLAAAASAGRSEQHQSSLHLRIPSEPGSNVARCGGSSCRSNSTHLAWTTTTTKSNSNADITTTCTWQPIQQAKKDAYTYLRRHVMAFDEAFLETMGFHEEDDDETDADGLADGLVESVLNLAVQAKIEFAYTDALPVDVWREYVLNPFNLNEARNNIRPLLWKKVIEPLFLNNTDADNEKRTIAETVKILNTHMWKLLAPAGSDSLYFVAGQCPAIFDPMSVLAFGYTSCTGFAILFVQGLRAAGVPARVAGTAAWHGKREEGNHNWVEVWTGASSSSPHDHEVCTCRLRDTGVAGEDFDSCHHCCGWAFLEPSAGAAQDAVDTVDRNPCERWFCNPNSISKRTGTRVYAARLGGNDDVHFPLAWEWRNKDVPGVDRTNYYQNVCSKCFGAAEEQE